MKFLIALGCLPPTESLHRCLLIVLATLSFSVSADLEGLSEAELSAIDGAGLGVVFENFKFSHGTDAPGADGGQGRVFRLGGIRTSDGRDVEVMVNHLYISGAGSQYGQALSPVNLGRLVNPYSIDVIDGNSIGVRNRAVLELAAPTMIDPARGYDCISATAGAGSGSCSSRPATGDYIGERADIGLQLNATFGGDRSANINIHAKSAVIDGSYIRIWGDDDRRQMAGQFKLNFYTPELSINACNQDGSSCGSRITMQNFAMELALGNQLQPVFFDVDGSGNFVFEVAAIDRPSRGAIGSDGLRGSSNPARWDFYNEYYTNPEYRSNLHIGTLSVGDRDFGSSRIEGMLIQHLEIRTKDLGK